MKEAWVKQLWAKVKGSEVRATIMDDLNDLVKWQAPEGVTADADLAVAVKGRIALFLKKWAEHKDVEAATRFLIYFQEFWEDKDMYKQSC